MKKIFKAALIVAVMLFAGNLASAQTKVGYINLKALIDAMPETKGIQTQLDTYQKQFSDQLGAMNTEYQNKIADYQKNRASMNDATRTAKEGEIQDIEKRAQAFNTNAQQQMSNKMNELSKPLVDKARATVTAVAKEKGYTYVLDTAQVDLIVSPEGDDLLPAVKAKLGIK